MATEIPAIKVVGGGAPETAKPIVEDARRVLAQQAAAIGDVAARLDERFAQAADLLLSTLGHVVIFGIGKSGIIGHKIASTMASTGTPAIFISAAEARHGDLGMVTPRDTAIVISYSGETEEVIQILPHLRALEVPIIAMVGVKTSTLATYADIVLDVGVESEACPHNLAPTNSALTTLAVGDALAVALMRARNFQVADFAKNHPGGSLGRQLATNLRAKVRDAMRDRDLPMVAPTDTIGTSLLTMTAGRLGMAVVTSGDRLVGLVTDGDLRRAMQRHPDILTRKISEIMTTNPATIDEDSPLADAHARMLTMKLKALVVVGRHGKVTGVIEVFDHVRTAAAD